MNLEERHATKPERDSDSAQKPAQIMSYTNTRQSLMTIVQNSWFNDNRVRMLPESTIVDANVGIYW